jgi:hypothetical protein
MTEIAAAQLVGRLRRSPVWPPPAEKKARAKVALWSALRESDDAVIRRIMEWPAGRQLVIDNLPEKISEAYGSLLFGEDPDFAPADRADAERLTGMVEENMLPTAFHDAEVICSSEGEVWWRISTNPDASLRALIDFHSRSKVVPLFYGRKLVAVAFVNGLPSPNGEDAGENAQVWRHVEIQSRGRLENLLFVGTKDKLGDPVALTRHPETAALRGVWQHDLPGILAGRIVNKLGRDAHLGVSDYQGVWSQFLVLNEATTIGRENMRLTAKKRMVVPASAVKVPFDPAAQAELVDRGDGSMAPKPSARVDLGEDVLINDELDTELGKDGSTWKVLEYGFDAQALIAYMQHVVETICIRSDIVPQFIGQGEFRFGRLESGSALRVVLMPTINAAESKGRSWDDELPQILRLMQLLEAKPAAEGGLGIADWTDPAGKPGFKRAPALPVDLTELANRHATLKNSDLISIEQSIKERYPQWGDDQITAELDRIREDLKQGAPARTPLFGP